MRRIPLLISGLALALGACAEDHPTAIETPTDPTAIRKIKKDLVAEGERLFFEETFGGNGRTCGTCHPKPDFLLVPADIAVLPSDDLLFKGELDINETFLLRGLIQYPLGGASLLEPELRVLRSIPTIANLRSTAPFTADGRAARLEDQALEAVLLHALDGAVDVPGERLPSAEELQAIAAFQESIQVPQRDFGRRPRGKVVARGQALFNTKAACGLCHFGQLLTDNSFHNTGVVNDTAGDIDISDVPFDPGRCRVNPGANDCQTSGASFNTPQLRGIRSMAPFFHNNSRATLRRVVEFYNSELFTSSPANQRLGIGPLNLTTEEIDAITAFLADV